MIYNNLGLMSEREIMRSTNISIILALAAFSGGCVNAPFLGGAKTTLNPPMEAVAPVAVEPATATRPGKIAPEPVTVEAVSISPPDIAGTAEIITEDTIWSGKVTVDGAVTVSPQATLTISPGTTVEFGQFRGRKGVSMLLVQGRLVAQGTKTEPIRFVAAEAASAPGAWRGILFLASEKKNLLEHCIIEGAETAVAGEFSTLTIKNTSFSRCNTGIAARESVVQAWQLSGSGCDLGMNLLDSEAEVVRAELSSNRKGILIRKSSLYLADSTISGTTGEALSGQGGSLKLTGNTITRNGSGLSLSSFEGTISGNRIVLNGEYGISLAGSSIKVVGNEISRNRGMGIKVADGGAIAWGNTISSNGKYDIYNSGPENFTAIGNWWGPAGRDGFAGKLHHGNGKILLFPVLEKEPVIGR